MWRGRVSYAFSRISNIDMDRGILGSLIVVLHRENASFSCVVLYFYIAWLYQNYWLRWDRDFAAHAVEI